MPTVKKGLGLRPAVLDLELENRLVDGMDFFAEDRAWNVDDDLRRKLWFRYRDVLVERWGDVTKMVGWYEFEATPEQRAAFRHDECPDPGRAVRDGIGTVSTPENLSLQALRASQRSKNILNGDDDDRS